jgi:hypothetical protein
MTLSGRIQTDDRVYGVLFFATLFAGWWIFLTNAPRTNFVTISRHAQTQNETATAQTQKTAGHRAHQTPAPADLIQAIASVNENAGFEALTLTNSNLILEGKYILLTDHRRNRISEVHSNIIKQALVFLPMPRKFSVEHSHDIPEGHIKTIERFLNGYGGEAQERTDAEGQNILRINFAGAK